jgi:hypothetical protein
MTRAIRMTEFEGTGWLLGPSAATMERDWQAACAWLCARLTRASRHDA